MRVNPNNDDNDDSKYQAGEIGRQLGHEGVEQVVGNVERYCECEQQRIALENQAKIMALRAELALLAEREQHLKENLRQAPPSGDLRSRRRKARYSWAVAFVLIVAGIFFSLLAFDPFRLGWKSYLYCLGITIIMPFGTEKFLEVWGKERLMKTLATLTFVAALSGLMLLAVVRGDVLAQQIREAESAVTIAGDDTSAVPAQPQSSFYDEAVLLLRLVMVLLALAMDVGAGLALHDARRLGAESAEDPKELSAELGEVHRQMVAGLQELTALENEAAVFAARFWRDFYRSMLAHTVRSALTKILVLALALLVFLPGRLLAAERVNLVVLVDLTQSVAVKGPDGKTDYEKNLQAITSLLAHLPTGSHVTVLGITNQSFAHPYILLSADIGEDEGYFKERLASARRQLVQSWQKRCGHLERNFAHTDILGALLLASQIFQQSLHTGKNVLVIFSDMRQNTNDLDIETPAAVAVRAALAKVESKKSIANLKDAEVYVLGADNAGKPLAYWQGLQEFWLAYFTKAGSHVEQYSVLRDPPEFGGEN